MTSEVSIYKKSGKKLTLQSDIRSFFAGSSDANPLALKLENPLFILSYGGFAA
jgi:hypothetical protein